MCTSHHRVSGWATEDGFKLFCDTEPLALRWGITFSPYEMPFLKLRSWLHTLPVLVDAESDTASMLHAMAYSKQSCSSSPLNHMRGPCSYARRLSLVEFKGNVVARSYMPVCLHHAVCEPPTLFRSRLCVCNLFLENPLF